MAIGLKFRDMIPQWAIDELDQLVSAIRSFLITPTGEHNDDGTHADITAETITLQPILDNEVQQPQIVWSNPHGPLQITGHDNSAVGHAIDILAERTAFAGDQLNLVSIKAFSTPTGLTPAFSTLTVFATHVSGSPVRFIQMDSEKVQLTSGCNLNLDVGDIFEGARTTGLGMHENFTPTFTNLSVGNGTLTSRVSRIGKTVVYQTRLVFGTTTSVSGSIIVNLPETLNTIFPGHAYFFDSSAVQFHTGIMLTVTGTTMAFHVTGSPTAVVNATVPFTWTTSDELVFQAIYEMT